MAPDPESAIAQECVEGYLFVRSPLRLLVLRRPPSRDRIWVPVSGKVEARDESLRAALARELEEETGFHDFVQVLDLDWAVPFDGPDGRRWRLHAFGVELPEPRAPRLSPEHEAYEWVDAQDAVDRLHYADNQEAVRRLAERLDYTPASSAR